MAFNILKGLAKKGLGMLGKKKPTPTPKPSRPKTAKEKHDEFMQKDPYERAAIISRRESAKRGDVWTGTSIVGTPSPHRSAKAIKKYSGPGSYQLTDPARKRRGPKATGGRIGLQFGGPPSRSDKASRKEDISHQRQLDRAQRKKEKDAYWEKQDVRDVKGKVIPVAGKPHSTYAGRRAERRTGYLRKNKRLPGQKNFSNRTQFRPTISPEKQKTLTNIKFLKKKGGKI